MVGVNRLNIWYIVFLIEYFCGQKNFCILYLNIFNICDMATMENVMVLKLNLLSIGVEKHSQYVREIKVKAMKINKLCVLSPSPHRLGCYTGHS